jgi:shikimate 5-dehydrogenase
VADIVFVGVSTGSSLVHEAMASWRPLLPVECGLRAVDVPLDAADDAYVELLNDIRGDPSVLGAVVTSHKVRLYTAGRAEFAWLDSRATDCREVNAIRRTSEGLLGWARDPVSVGRVVDRIWPHADGTVVCLGSGGTAVALAHHLLATRGDVRIVCADPRPSAVRQLVRLAPDSVVGHVGAGPWDSLVNDADQGTLVVNATGMGKDRPGCPVTDAAEFPEASVVWELNYRGDLQLLRLARLQAGRSSLSVHDGWELFCHGWAAALTVVLDLPEDATLGDRFAVAARSLRPPPSATAGPNR